MTVVSYSELYKWQTCRRQYYYRYVLGRKPIEESNAISTGVKGHKLLQSFYELLKEGKGKTEALEHVTENALKIANEGRFSDKELIAAWTLVDNYIKTTDFTAQALLVENRFLLPVSKLTDDPTIAHVQIGFTPDIVFERVGGWLDVEDYKFIQRAWVRSKINRFPQLKLYHIFLNTMGYDISRSVLRMFNVTTGKIIAHPYVLKGEERATLIHDLLEAIRELVAYKDNKERHATAARTLNYTACQYCSYEFPCTLEAEGKDATKSLDYLYKKSDYDYLR